MGTYWLDAGGLFYCSFREAESSTLVCDTWGFDTLVCDSGRRIFGGLGAALRQIAHFVGSHGKAHSGFSGTGRFHRRVQRQDVGLKSDFVDHANDPGMLFAVLAGARIGWSGGGIVRGHCRGHRLLQGNGFQTSSVTSPLDSSLPSMVRRFMTSLPPTGFPPVSP